MIDPEARAQAVRCVIDAIRDAGLSNSGNAALIVATRYLDGERVLDSPSALEHVLPTQFLNTNQIDATAAHSVLAPLQQLLDRLAARSDPLTASPLIPITEIDSFAKVSTVPADQVMAFAQPLELAEDIVEQMITKIIGEPYRQKDWGGELDDLYTNRVRLAGRDVMATFLLKGHGLRRKMRPADLGKNGDQISRMTSQPAEIFVVQHVHAIDAAVVRQLSDAVIARRAAGNRNAVGTVWDGVTTARLGVAYGVLDPATGVLIPGTLT